MKLVGYCGVCDVQDLHLPMQSFCIDRFREVYKYYMYWNRLKLVTFGKVAKAALNAVSCNEKRVVASA